MVDLDRLLGFVSAHRNGMKVFRHSTMNLDVLTDASFLSRPNVGLANKTIKPKMSNSCDMRFHWLQDRVQRRQFRVQHVPGV
jgi:hypothetical protein